jgi:hypothetical protein
MKPASILIATFCLLLFVTPKAFASAETEVNSALAVAQTWVAEIDSGKYDDSYAFGCEAMHDKVAQDRWAEVLRGLRSPWGAVVSRKQISHVYKGDGFEGTPGEFMVITYDSSFQKVDAAKEVVVLKWESGKWRGAGYNLGAKSTAPDAGSPNQAAQSATEIQTDPHYVPTPH